MLQKAYSHKFLNTMKIVVRRAIYNFPFKEEKNIQHYGSFKYTISEQFQGQLSHLREVNVNLGFRWKRIKNKKCVLKQQQEIKTKGILHKKNRTIHESKKETLHDESGEGAAIP